MMISLGRKVLLAALAALTLLGGLYELVGNELDRWNEASANVMRDYQRAIVDGEFHAALARASGELASFVLTGNHDYHDESREGLARAAAAIDQLHRLVDLEPPGAATDHIFFMQRQTLLLQSLRGAFEQIAEPSSAARGTSEMLRRIYAHEADGDTLWREITAHHQGEQQKNADTLSGHARRAHLLFLSGVGMCLVASLLVFVYVRRRIVDPVTVLAQLTRSVAAGNLTPRARVTQRDEIGQLQRSFNQMMVELGGQRQQLTSLIDSLATSRDTAEQANRAKTDFLANVSHELRTPMNGVLVSLELMHETAPNPEQRDLADMARSSARRLLGLLNDLLSFSRIEAGNLALLEVDFDARALVGQMVELHGCRARAKGVAVSCQIDDAIPAGLRGDPMRLGQVLLNLLDNAIKYTDQGRIAVTMSLVPGAAAPAGAEPAAVGLRFSVADTGIGIAPAAAQHIFQPFFQATSAGGGYREGIGLGLGIARQLAQMMGGELSFESEPGKGSTFCFTVRLHLAAQGSAPAGPSPTLAGPLPVGKVVLLAEDNRTTREVMARMLARRGLRVVTAVNGREAVDLVRAEKLDLVMMDCRMDVMDGFEATRAIRALGGDKARVPIVALTAYGLTGTKEDFIAAGFDDLVVKPYAPEDIEAMLHRWLMHGCRDVQATVAG